MSVVVAIKDKDRVWMACDSQVTWGWSKRTLTNPNNYKICRPEKELNTLVGVVGDAKLMNVIKIQERFIDELTLIKNEFNFKYVVEKIVPDIFKLASKYDVADKVKDQDYRYLNGEIVFAHKECLYKISHDGCVIEIDDFCATGSGLDFSYGYLNESEDVDIKERIIKAVASACKTDLYVNYPIIITNTLDGEFIIVNDNKEEQNNDN